MTTEYGQLPTEREILRVLWGSEESLVRSQIHRRMPHAYRPTLGRVGQILAALHQAELLHRQQKKAQGSRKASFYDLSRRGKALCRELGFEHDERLLFDAPAKMLHENLTRRQLAGRPTTPGKIIAAYSYRGGLGQTTMIAHATRGLAEALPLDQQLLAVDLDLEAPGLDALGPAEEIKRCRGLGGLILDFERRAPDKRTLWLHGALGDPRYVLQAAKDLPQLRYLPNGLGSSATGLTASERAEAMALLRSEAAALTAGNDQEKSHSSSFVTVFREVASEKFAKILVDTQTKASLGAWLGTQCLTDDLALCIDYKDTSHATLSGLRSVLANFLAKKNATESSGRVLYFFRLAGPKTKHELGQWIEECLLKIKSTVQESTTYPAEEIPYNIRLVGDYDKKNTPLYRRIVACMNQSGTEPDKLPVEIKALLAILDPSSTEATCSVALGLLKRASLQELVRLVEWHSASDTLPVKTDERGRRLLGKVIDDLLISKILTADPEHRESK